MLENSPPCRKFIEKANQLKQPTLRRCNLIRPALVIHKETSRQCKITPHKHIQTVVSQFRTFTLCFPNRLHHQRTLQFFIFDQERIKRLEYRFSTLTHFKDILPILNVNANRVEYLPNIFPLLRIQSTGHAKRNIPHCRRSYDNLGAIFRFRQR